LAALVLAGSAVVAITVGPTEAIVVASLAVGAVWILPSTRHRIFNNSLTLRDTAGQPRLIMAVTDNGNPTFSLLDEKGHRRMLLGLSDDGTPVFALLGEDEHANVQMANPPAGPALLLLDSDGNGHAGFGFLETKAGPMGTWPGDTVPAMDVGDTSWHTMVLPGHVLLDAEEAGASVQCSSGDSEASLTATREWAALQLQPAGDRGVLAGAGPDRAQVAINASGDAWVELLPGGGDPSHTV
jgi:hypothetical protein